MNRIVILILAVVLAFGIWHYKEKNELKNLSLEYSKLVYSEWTLDDVRVFLESLPRQDLDEFGRLTDKPNASAVELTDHLMKLSSYAFAYPFKDTHDVNYHKDILIWSAQKNGVAVPDSQGSFLIERSILENKFAEIWDRLTPQQRTEVFNSMKVSGLNGSQKAALIAGTGAAAVAMLSATVAFSGFAFYTTMSTAIATSAGLLGVTLPFSVYAGASSTVAVLSGPIGWGIALIAGTGAVIWATAPDADKTTAFILALHVYKAKRAEEIAKKIQDLDGEVAVI